MRALLFLSLLVVAASAATLADEELDQLDVTDGVTKQWLAAPRRLRNAVSQCSRQVVLLAQKEKGDGKSAKALHSAVLKARSAAKNLPVAELEEGHLSQIGLTDVLVSMDIQLPKGAKPKKGDVVSLLTRLSRSLREQRRRQRRVFRRAVSNCARACRSRQRILKNWAKRIFFWRSLARRRLAVSRKNLFALTKRLQQHQAELRTIRKQVASNKNASKRALGTRMLTLAKSILARMWREAFVARRQVHARYNVFHSLSFKARKAGALFARAQRRCGRLANVRVRPAGGRRAGKKGRKSSSRSNNSPFDRFVNRARSVARRLLGMRRSGRRSLKRLARKHRAIAAKARRAFQHEKAVRLAQPRAAYMIVSRSSSSGLRINYNPKTGVAKPIRVNPGKFPPKYKWAFHTTSTSLIPLSGRSRASIRRAVSQAVSSARFASNRRARRFVSRIMSRFSSARAVPQRPVPARKNASAADRARASQFRTAAVIRRVQKWLSRFPTVIRQLQKWFVSRRKSLWAWYLRNGQMKRYARYLRLLKQVYAHRLLQMRAVSRALHFVQARAQLQLRIAQVKQQMAAVSAALRQTIIEQRQAKRAQKQYESQAVSRRCAASQSYAFRGACLKICPAPFVADRATSRCAPPAVNKLSCGKNMAVSRSSGRCECISGFAFARNGRFCVPQQSRRSRLCPLGRFASGSRCVRKCPSPLVADVQTRTCSKADGLTAERRAFISAKTLAAKARALAREQERALLRERIRRLQAAHSKATRRAQRLARALFFARQTARAVRLQGLRASASAGDRKRQLLSARARVTELERRRRAAQALLRRIRDAQKRSVARVSQLERDNKKDIATAIARVRALNSARDRVLKLAEAYRRAKIAASRGNGRIAAAREELAREELARAERTAHVRARELRQQRDDLLKRAADRVAALQRAQNAAEAAAKRLADQQRADARKAAEIARQKQAAIAAAKAQAAALEAKAHGVLARCIRGDHALRKAKKELLTTAEKKATLAAAANARVRARSAAVRRARILARKASRAFRRAKRLFHAKLAAARRCRAVSCECRSDACVARKRAALASLASAAAIAKKARAAAAAVAPSNNSKTAQQKRARRAFRQQAVGRLRRFMWKLHRTVAALGKRYQRLNRVVRLAAGKKKAEVIAQVKGAAAKVLKRIAGVRAAGRRVLTAALANKWTRRWLLKNRHAIRSLFKRGDKWVQAALNAPRE